MLYALTTVALAVVGAHAKQLVTTAVGGLDHPAANPVDHSGSVPVFDLGSSVAATPNITVGDKGAPVDATAQISPASIRLCELPGCVDRCYDFDLNVLPHEMCLSSGLGIASVELIQPSGEGLPYSVYLALPNCTGQLAQIPGINVCYAIINGVFESVFLGPDQS